MSGETARQESGWTTDTLRQDVLVKIDDLEKLFNQRFIDNDKAIQAALLAAKEAVAAALAAAKEAGSELKLSQGQQLDAHNGLIRKMEVQTNTFPTRTEVDLQIKALSDKYDALIKPINDYITTQQGQVKGSSDSKTGLFIAIGVVGTILTIILTGLTIIVLLANGVFK